MARYENKPHRSPKWKTIHTYISIDNLVMSLATTLVLGLLLVSQVSNAQYVTGGHDRYEPVADNGNNGLQMIYHPQQKYPGSNEIRNGRGSSGIEDHYAGLAAFAGISLVAAAISVNMLNYNGGMMKSVISPFGFGRTSTSTDVSSRIPNLEAAEGSYEDQGHIERFFDVADSWSRAIGMNECGQAAICEAHANNRDYGLLALPILFFFPGSRSSNGSPASVWQEAALRGKARDSCSSRYSCLLNPMWIVKFLMTTLVY